MYGVFFNNITRQYQHRKKRTTTTAAAPVSADRNIDSSNTEKNLIEKNTQTPKNLNINGFHIHCVTYGFDELKFCW